MCCLQTLPNRAIGADWLSLLTGMQLTSRSTQRWALQHFSLSALLSVTQPLLSGWEGVGVEKQKEGEIKASQIGFPNEPAAGIALNTVKSWIEENPDKLQMSFYRSNQGTSNSVLLRCPGRHSSDDSPLSSMQRSWETACPTSPLDNLC
ncbi:hypothetical protein EYF80_015437 [Liparis tanakae]|uniref:Uncharacterized protein n=1 Tax=Liparis tanakae TaxID=230148 RepID=A0A4Z2IAN3_9TELE|nr:hypothetical protein EYF80_015437 [Liparis tanakae]